MADVISFRPHRREEAVIEHTMRAKGFKTRSEAVRYLIVHGPPVEARRDPLLEFRLPPEFQTGRTLTVEEIDEELYGGEP